MAWSPCSEDYDDEYSELSDLNQTITDIEEEKVRAATKNAAAKKGRFGAAADKIDLD